MRAPRPQDNFSIALALLDQAGEEAALLPPLSALRTSADLVRRARMVRSVAKARGVFRQIHDRAEGLSEALARFRQRKRQLCRDE